MVNVLQIVGGLRRAGDEDDPVSLQAFVLASPKDSFRSAVLVAEHAAHAQTGGTALAVSELDEPTLTCEDLGG